MSLLPLTKSITSIASKSLGSVTDFRKILSAAPSLSSFTFPPQIQVGIGVANALGLKIPTTPEAAITAILGSKNPINNVLGSIQNTTKQIEGILGQSTLKVNGVLSQAVTVEEALNRIEFLF